MPASLPLRSLAGLLAPALLLAACAGHEVDYQGEGSGFVGQGAPVRAVLETPSVGTVGDDAADDPAVWASKTPVTIGGVQTPGFVVGTDKKAGLYVYGFDGAILQFMPEGLLNNVDVAEGLNVDGRPHLLIGASDRTPGRMGVALYLFDPAGTGDNKVRYWGSITTDVVEPYGFCLARRGEEVHAILVGHEGELRQFVVAAGADGRPSAQLAAAPRSAPSPKAAPPIRRPTPCTSTRRTSACGATASTRPRAGRAPWYSRSRRACWSPSPKG